MRFVLDLLKDKVALVTGGGTGDGPRHGPKDPGGARAAVLGRWVGLIEPTAHANGHGQPRHRHIGRHSPDRHERVGDVADLSTSSDDWRYLVYNAGGQFVTPARELSNKGFETVILNNLIGPGK